jgi:hypothetical protein
VSRCGQISLFDPSILVTRRKCGEFNQFPLIKREAHGRAKSSEITVIVTRYKRTVTGYV